MFQKIFSIFLIFLLTFSNSFADLENSLTFEEKFSKNFEIKNVFQNPSYLLEKEIEKDEYICEYEDECKVNFDFRNSFSEDFKVKDFSCLLEYGEEKIETCNPNTILIEKEETEFKVKIFSKKDENIFKERIIKIIKPSPLTPLPEVEGNSGSGSENKEENGENETGSGETENNWNNEEKEENKEKENFIKNFEIKNTFQNPSYLLEKEIEKDEYFCEYEDECKVNFDFRNSFSEEFKSKYFSCLLEYGEEKVETCNPNTILVEKDTIFKIKIFDYKNQDIFKEREIKIFLKKEENKNDENTGSGSENKEENGENETGNGETENNGNNEEKEENKEKENFEKNFEIKNTFQNPSYLLEKEIEKDEYICEYEDECKVNFDFRNSFSDEFKAKDFSCILEFLEEKVENCNPNTILVEKEETEFKVKIFSKKDENIFKERIIKIIKPSPLTSLPEGEGNSGTGSENKEDNGENESGSGETENNGNNEEKENFEKNFEIKNLFQNPTTLLLKEQEKDIYICEKKECKVNFDFRNSFTEDFKSRNFSCEILFENQTFELCNPSTFEIKEGNSEVFVKIFNKKYKNIFKFKKYIIKNENLNNFNISKSSENTFFEKAKIGIQSGLLNRKCEKKDCKVNFIFETKNKDLVCKWDFGKGEFKENTENKCNPGVVKFPKGENFVILRVYEKGNENNFSEDYLEFENDFEESIDDVGIFLESSSKKYQVLENLAICKGVLSCKLNFSVKNTGKNINNFFWDFGNGEVFDGKNPKTVEFLKGKYKISLKVSDEKEEKELFFYLIVDENKKENIFEKIFKNDEIEDKIKKLKIRKNKENLIISGENEKNIFFNKTLDFGIFGKLFYDEKFILEVGEDGIFKEEFDYEDFGKFNFRFFENNEFGDKFLEERKIEISYKNYILAELLKIEKEEKEKQKELKKEENALKKVQNKKDEEEKFLKIILQGKSTKNKKFFEKEVVCIGDCSVNFGLETNIKGKNTKKIFWDLGNGEKFEGKNPKSVKYKLGIYKIFVKYLGENGEELKDEFTVKVNKKTKKIKKKKKKGKVKIGPVKLVIKVQGKISKNKILEENKLICFKTCSVNFDGRESSGAYKELIWDFGNGEKFVGENPKSVKYKDFGKYKVSLKTYDFKGNLYEKIFEIDFKEKKEKEKVDFSKIEKDLEKKEFKKEDFYFIFLIMIMFSSFSFILFRRYKII